MKEISLSVEETNKLRISLGLKPLHENKNEIGDSKERKQADADFKDDTQSDNSKPIQVPEKTNKILKKKRTLGEGKEESVGDFLKKIGKKAKITTSKTSSKPKDVYDQDNLQGLKIAHNLEDLPQESILVLRDQLIGDDEKEDELENISIKKPQKKKNLNVYEEYEREQLGLEKKLLDKYDDEEEVGFTLGKGGVKMNASKLEDLYDKVAKPGGISLDYKKTEMSDFLDVSFKKKKVKKMKKKKGGIDLEDIQEQKEYKEFENSNKQTDISSLNFVDDYDLQQSLARSRKKNVKQRSIINIELDQMEDEAMHADTNQVIISDLTEFVENLSSVPLLKQKDEFVDDVKKEPDNTNIHPVDTPASDHEVDMDVDMEIDEEPEQPTSESDADDAKVSRGLAGTLSLLSSRGDLAPTTSTTTKFTKSPEEILIEVQIKQDFQKYGRERDWPKRLKELEARRERARIKRLEGYKPSVELLHRDQTGRELTPKEAFKDFAQKFHGVKSGKNKVEKKLRRLKEELEMKKLDGDVAVRVTGQTPVVQEDKLPTKMEKGVIMELPVPGTKPVLAKKHAAIVEAIVTPAQKPSQPTNQPEPQPKTPAKQAVSPKRGKITFGFGKTKLAPKKLE